MSDPPRNWTLGVIVLPSNTSVPNATQGVAYLDSFVVNVDKKNASLLCEVGYQTSSTKIRLLGSDLSSYVFDTKNVTVKFQLPKLRETKENETSIVVCCKDFAGRSYTKKVPMILKDTGILNVTDVKQWNDKLAALPNRPTSAHDISLYLTRFNSEQRASLDVQTNNLVWVNMFTFISTATGLNFDEVSSLAALLQSVARHR